MTTHESILEVLFEPYSVRPTDLQQKIHLHHPADLLIIDTRKHSDYLKSSIIGAINIDISVPGILDTPQLLPLIKQCYCYNIVFYDENCDIDPNFILPGTDVISNASLFQTFLMGAWNYNFQWATSWDENNPVNEISQYNDRNTIFKARSIRFLQGGISEFRRMYPSLCCTNKQNVDRNTNYDDVGADLQYLTSKVVTKPSKLKISSLINSKTSMFKTHNVQITQISPVDQALHLTTCHLTVLELVSANLYLGDVNVLNDINVNLQDYCLDFGIVIDLTENGLRHSLSEEMYHHFSTSRKVYRLGNCPKEIAKNMFKTITKHILRKENTLYKEFKPRDQNHTAVFIAEDLPFKKDFSESVGLSLILGCLMEINHFTLQQTLIHWLNFAVETRDMVFEKDGSLPNFMFKAFDPRIWEALSSIECDSKVRNIFPRYYTDFDIFMTEFKGVNASLSLCSVPPFIWYLPYNITNLLKVFRRLSISDFEQDYLVQHQIETKKDETALSLPSSCVIN